ncbi:hypothetical protein [Haladaptatus sp. ZSTT2]|uniref:hypothetical protein n=1 Tax=Haladaptatus sp. ZSTT2 TaxID=3120515 RepID=UPI00300E7618
MYPMRGTSFEKLKPGAIVQTKTATGETELRGEVLAPFSGNSEFDQMFTMTEEGDPEIRIKLLSVTPENSAYKGKTEANVALKHIAKIE